MGQCPAEGCSRGRRGHPPSQQQAAASPWETLGDLAKKEMRGSIENTVCELAQRISFLMLGPLTWSHQLDLLRHGGAELVGRVAPVFALKRNQVLVQKHKSSIFVLATLCRHVWRLEFSSIFCPPISNVGEKTTFVTNHFHSIGLRRVIAAGSYSGGGFPFALHSMVTLWWKGRAMTGLGV